MDGVSNGVVEVAVENLTPDPSPSGGGNSDLATTLSSGEVEVQAAPTLGLRVNTLLGERRQKRLDAAIEATTRDMARYSALVEAMPEIWRMSGLLALVGPGVVGEDGEGMSISGRCRVGDLDVVATLSVTVEQSRGASPYVGMKIGTAVGEWSEQYFRQFHEGSFPDVGEQVVKIVAEFAYKARVLRPKARVVARRAQEIAFAWQKWDEACRAYAGDVTLRRWEPVEMWSVTCGMLNVLGEEHGKKRNKKVVALESPIDISGALRGKRPALLTVVEDSGRTRQVWAFAVSEVERVEDGAPTIESALPYHRSYQVGKYWVNLPATLPTNVDDEIVLASHKNGLWDVVGGVKNPAGLWNQFCEQMGVGLRWDSFHCDFAETRYPQTLAKMTVDEIVTEYAGALGWKELKDGAL